MKKNNPPTMSKLAGILADLQGKKAALDEEMGAQDTSHPSASVENNTTGAGLEGARSAESSSDVKKEQPVGIANAGSPEVKDPAGSMGVESKEPEDGADLDKGNESGVSEMANTDTDHASKSASDQAKALVSDLNKLIKSAKDEDEYEYEYEEKTAEAAAYVEKLASSHSDEVEAGYKTAANVLDLLYKAALEVEPEMGGAEAQMPPGMGMGPGPGAGGMPPSEGEPMGPEGEIEELAEALAEAGVSPEDLAAMLEDQEGGGEGEIEDLAEALAEAGVSPEDLADMLEDQEGGGEMGGAPEMGGGEELGEGDQMQALEQALAEAGVSPEELVAAASGGGGASAPMDTMAEGVDDQAKAASAKDRIFTAFQKQSDAGKSAKIAALKTKLVGEIKTFVGKN